MYFAQDELIKTAREHCNRMKGETASYILTQDGLIKTARDHRNELKDETATCLGW
jgi:hypothetical protein